MATVGITGTIQTAAGEPVENVVVRLRPAPKSPNSAETIGGVGIISDPVEVLTDASGDFLMPAVQGFSYTLEIPALGLVETFSAPFVAEIRFDLLGFVPLVRQAKDYVDADEVAHVIVQVQTPRVASVLERFDSLLVERAAELTGPWSEVDTVDLVSDTDSYDVNDDEVAVYYRARYTSTSGDESDNSDPVLGDSFRESLVLSISEFKDVYLFALDLNDPATGLPYPSIMFEWYIRAATAWMEHTLDISIVAHDVVDETHDHYGSDYGQWGYLQTKEYPVIRVDEVRFQYPSMTDPVVIHDEWVILEDGGCHGVIQLVPGQGSISDVLLTPGSLLPLWSGGGRVPAVWHLDYRAGFEVDAIPYDIKHLVGMMASLGIMNVAGDLVGGSGLQGWSTSIPGLSQNITTTNSSTNAGFGARIIEYMKEIKMMLPVVKDYYGKRIKMVVG